MKKLSCLLCLMISILLAGCGNENVDSDIDVEIEAAGDSNTLKKDEKHNDETDFSYADLREIEFWFGSGAGAWSTTMTIGEDGSFEGEYSDSDMGDAGDGYLGGTRYYCKFSGQLSELTKMDELTYTAELANISYENTVGEEEYADDVRYIYSDAYGLDNAGTIYFYLPGTKREKLPEDCLSWVSQAMYDEDYNPVDELNFVCLYNKSGEEAFYSYSLVENFIKFFSFYEDQEQYYLDELENLVTQKDMTENAYNRYKLWDAALNEEWNILMSILDEEEKEQLRAEEREWITCKDSAVEAAGAQADDVSMQPMLEYNEGAEITKARVCELKELLERKSGVVIEADYTAVEAKYVTIDLSTSKETHIEGVAVTPLNLKIISEEDNGIDWANDWYSSKNLTLPMVGDGWDHFYDDVYEYQWIGDQLNIYEKETGNCLYVLEYPTDKWYVNGNNAYLKDGIFYGASVTNGYAQPDTCFLFAYDLKNDKLLWRSADQSYNTMNFVVKGNIIICGYGFTNEKDYLYQIDIITGEILDRTELKTMPDLLVEQDGKLYVHTYSYNYIIEFD